MQTPYEVTTAPKALLPTHELEDIAKLFQELNRQYCEDEDYVEGMFRVALTTIDTLMAAMATTERLWDCMGKVRGILLDIEEKKRKAARPDV